jgi:hypothetical protein
VGGTEALAAAMLETLESDTHPDVASRAQFYSLERAISGYSALLGLDE